LAAAKRLAHHDDVSGLPNHRAALAMLERTLRRHQHCREQFAVLFIDGDSLKLHNQSGYEAGNRMIARLAATLVQRLRPTDFVARWLCGDEFLAILPGSSGEAAQQAAERLRAAVQREYMEAPIPATISVGIAVYPADGSTPDGLVARAISYSGEAKRAGKNRIFHALCSGGGATGASPGA
jgi:diguanylate cyclase (GGDEF)-like protein